MERKKNYVFTVGVFAALILVAAPVGAATVDQPWPVKLRSQMARLTDVGYRLGLASAPLCPSTAAGTGIALDYIEAYDARDRSAISALLHLTDLPQIAAVASGSPAEIAGIKPGDDIVSIGGLSIAQLQAGVSDRALLADELEQRLGGMPKEQPIAFVLRRDGRTFGAEVMPRTICAARFILKTGNGISAYSDGANVAVSSGIVEFTRNDDELALVAAHEAGHVINQDEKAAGLRERRQMEDRADIMGLRLMRCAGYDPETGFQFWFRRQAKDWLNFLRSPTHRSPKSRVQLMREDAANATCPPARTQAFATGGSGG